ncbi:polysaccharide biosynthesis tyrosine autokinase [Limibacter armeniacum]|uniref:polysaccharide biosynthesis tyrosine autokinase n=1 Tax=Limibacter armeniacum TaxID=466084 RepID=UPI002FE64312
MIQTSNSTNFTQEDEISIDLGRWFSYLKSKWYLIVVGAIVGLLVGYFISKTIEPKWSVSTKFVKQLQKDKLSNLPLDLGLMGEMGASGVNLEYEKGFFFSRKLINELTNDLSLNVSYYQTNGILRKEIFEEIPFILSYDSSSSYVPYDIEFTINKLDQNSFTLSSNDEYLSDGVNNQVFNFGKYYEIFGFKFLIKQDESNVDQNEISVLINSQDRLVEKFRSSFSLSMLGEQTNEIVLLKLSSQGTNTNREREIHQRLIEIAREYNVEEKNEVEEKTIRFIEEQLNIVADSMKHMATRMHTLKIKDKNLAGGSEKIFEKIYEIEEKRTELELAVKYCKYLKSYILNNKEEELVTPNVFGVENEVLTSLVSQYINTKIESEAKRNDLVEMSPIFEIEMKERTKILEGLEKSILTNISNMLETYEFRLKETKSKISLLFSSVEPLMEDEKSLEGFKRLYNLNEQLYLVLLEKKAESSISKAASLSNYKQLEVPEVSLKPVTPSSIVLMGGGGAFGVIVVVCLIISAQLFNRSIHEIEDVEAASHLPIIGVIQKAFDPDKLHVVESPKSSITESFRSIRANFKYLTKSSDKATMLLTSMMSGEGKTYISANLAASLSMINKKTVLIGADIRKPQLETYFKDLTGKGLSDYLVNAANVYELLQDTHIKNLSVIHSGPIPPNPSELLMSEKMSELITELKEIFDIIIIDTAPIGLVSDTLPLLELSDANLLVVRQGRSQREMLSKAETILGEKVARKSSIIFNGVDFSKLHSKYIGPGYGGYVYDDSYFGEGKIEKRPYQRFIDKLLRKG